MIHEFYELQYLVFDFLSHFFVDGFIVLTDCHWRKALIMDDAEENLKLEN